uniref:Uncharacterized protein n=1 Tax=Glossina pallidipes TaxID=7398 RepID=A0A1A9Z736_GLOPL
MTHRSITANRISEFIYHFHRSNGNRHQNVNMLMYLLTIVIVSAILLQVKINVFVCAFLHQYLLIGNELRITRSKRRTKEEAWDEFRREKNRCVTSLAETEVPPPFVT